jgi:hypothetical protein
MGDVVELKTKKVLGRDSINIDDFLSGNFNEKHQCRDPHCNTVVVTEYTYSEYIRLVEQEVDIKHMSLWGRIFNWPS